MNKRSRRMFWVAVAVVGILGLAYAGQQMVEASSGTREGALYKVETLTRGDLAVTISSTGTLVAQGTVEVGTQVSGTMDRVLTDHNDQVEEGQVLAVLEQELFEAAVQAAEASVASRQADLDQALVEHERHEALHDQGILSDQEFLPYETAARTARAGLKLAQADLRREKINLDHTVIRSPIGGVVIERNVEEGQTVAASLSTPTLFIIAEDLASMEIEADVDESDIGRVEAGQEVSFTVPAYPDDIFGGIVSEVRLNPSIVSNVVTYTVVVEAGNESGLLLPGMTATLDFRVEEARDALLVPNSALAFAAQDGAGGSSPAVYVLDGSPEPRRVEVTPEITDRSMTALQETGNLAEGVRVVTGRDRESDDEESGNLMNRLMPRPSGGGGPRM